MRRNRRVAAIAAALAAMAGCGTGADGQPAPSAPAQPREVLRSAVPDDRTPAYRFTVDDGELVLTGVADPATRAVELATQVKEDGITVDMRFLTVGTRSWVRFAFSGVEGGSGLDAVSDAWLLIDPAKLPDDDAVPRYEGADVAGLAAVVEGIVDAAADGPGGYRGTADITAADVVEADVLAALGEAAKAVPFTAEVDTQGRLTSFALDVPAAGEHPARRHTAEYTEYGAAKPPTAPADARPAPALAYEILGG